jgi:hypothetical protein
MAIAPAGLFDYVAVIPAGRGDPPWIMRQHERDQRTLKGNRIFDDRLVGLNPTLDCSGDIVTLTAASRERASCQAASFEVAPRLLSSLMPEDVLHIVRTGSGGVGLSVIRDTRPILAIGAIRTLPLDPLVVRIGPNVTFGRNVFSNYASRGQARAAGPFWSARRWLGAKWPRPGTWVEVTAGNATKVLRDQQEATVGEYSVFVERSWRDGIPGEDEAVAVYRSDENIREVAIESTKRLAKAHHDMRLVQWSGTVTQRERDK